MVNNGIRIITNHKPVYCHECRSRDTFEKNKAGDIKTESGKVYMLGWRCSVCGHTSITSNPDYKSPMA